MARGERSGEITNKFCDGEREKNRALFAHFDSVLTGFLSPRCLLAIFIRKLGWCHIFDSGDN